MTGVPVFPFIVGRGRSGTTLVRAMFNAHPQLCVPEESHFVVTMGLRRHRYEEKGLFSSERFLGELFRHYGFRRWQLAPDLVAESFASSPPVSYAEAIRRVFTVRALSDGKMRYADKTPIYVMHIRFIAELFPESRFIHVVRDGRDVTLSYLEAGLGPRSLAGNAVYWRRFVGHGRREGLRLGPSRYRELRYEDLVDDPERHLRALCDYIDLDFDPTMLRYHERAEQLHSSSRDQRIHRHLALPPTKGLRDWRSEMSSHEETLFEGLAGDLLGDLGYERLSPNLPARVRLAARARELLVHLGRATGRIRNVVRRLRASKLERGSKVRLPSGSLGSGSP